MKTRIKFNCALPLLVSSAESVYEVWVDFGETTQAWHVVVGRLGDRGKHSITAGNATRADLERALGVGVDLAPGRDAQAVATELVNLQRAEFIEAA